MPLKSNSRRCQKRRAVRGARSGNVIGRARSRGVRVKQMRLSASLTQPFPQLQDREIRSAKWLQMKIMGFFALPGMSLLPRLPSFYSTTRAVRRRPKLQLTVELALLILAMRNMSQFFAPHLTTTLSTHSDCLRAAIGTISNSMATCTSCALPS